MALDPEDGLFGIDSQGQEVDGHLEGVLFELLEIRSVAEGVVVGDEGEELMLLLETQHLCDGAEVVSEMKFARWLDAGEYSHYGRNPL